MGKTTKAMTTREIAHQIVRLSAELIRASITESQLTDQTKNGLRLALARGTRIPDVIVRLDPGQAYVMARIEGRKGKRVPVGAWTFTPELSGEQKPN